MADQDPLNRSAAQDFEFDDDHVFRNRLSVSASDIVPIGPNIFATMAGYIALLLVPWVSLQILAAVSADASGEDQVASLFIVGLFAMTTFVAAGFGALFFLVIGIILQAWQYRRPFPSGRPILLAFPIAWGLIVPEVLLRGGSLLPSIVVTSAIAVAFGIHWTVVVVLSDTLS
jgi:hypothetical protein